MSNKISLLLLGILFSLTYASGYCYQEKLAGESCYQDCCTSLGYTWNNGGCGITEEQQNYVASQCMYCTDEYTQCMENYSSGGDSQSGGCCAGIILPGIIALSVVFMRG